MILQHYIDFLDGNGFITVKPPIEWKKIEMNLSFEEGNSKLSDSAFTWVGDNAEQINTYVENGGVFEGLPYQIRFTCNNIQYTFFDGCLDLAADQAEFSCEQVKSPIREKGKIDYLNEMFDSFRFEYLFAIRQPTLSNPIGTPVAGQITFNDFIDIWYVQGQYPQKFEILITSLTLFVTLKEVYETIKRIADVLAEAFSVPSGGITSVLQLLYLAIYLALLVVALVELFKKLIDLIFPFVYFHRAMYVGVMMEKGCEYLGLNFSSSIFSSGGIGEKEYLMPEKNEEGVKVGYSSPETGFHRGTFGDLIRSYKEKYNAEVRVIGNTVYFEREDFFIEQSTFKIPDIYQKPTNSVKYNTSDIPANYVISYRYDTADLNNLRNREGSQFTAKTEPVVMTNPKNNLLKGLQERSIPFTLPLVKTTQSELETTMTGVFNALSSIINAVSSIISPSSTPIPLIPSGGQVNVLLMDTHLTSAPKCGIYLGGGKTHPQSINNYLSTTILWNQFHSIRSGYGFAPFPANQWVTHKDYEIPLCCDEYLLIKDNNYATFKGNDAKIKDISWVVYKQIAKLEFMERLIFAPDLKLTTIDWNGVINVYD